MNTRDDLQDADHDTPEDDSLILHLSEFHPRHDDLLLSCESDTHPDIRLEIEWDRRRGTHNRPHVIIIIISVHP